MSAKPQRTNDKFYYDGLRKRGLRGPHFAILAKGGSNIGEGKQIKIIVDGGGQPKRNTHPLEQHALVERERDKRGSMYGTHMEREGAQ